MFYEGVPGLVHQFLEQIRRSSGRQPPAHSSPPRQVIRRSSSPASRMLTSSAADDVVTSSHGRAYQDRTQVKTEIFVISSPLDSNRSTRSTISRSSSNPVRMIACSSADTETQVSS